MLNRRDFLQAGIGSLIGASSASARCRRRNRCAPACNDHVNEFVRMRNAIIADPNIASVRELIIPDAKKILVHWEQLHIVVKMTKEEMIMISDCQKDLYLAMKSLLRTHPDLLQRILNEGAMLNMENQNAEVILQQLRGKIRAVLLNQFGPARIPSPLAENEFNKGIKDIDTLTTVCNNMSPLGVAGGPFTLAYTNGIPVTGAEYLETDLECDRLNAIGEDEEAERYLYSVREGDVIKIASQISEAIIHVVFGCDHDFIKEILEWNEHHDEKFSLLVARPKTVVKNEGVLWFPMENRPSVAS
jgi:hypothetical protein